MSGASVRFATRLVRWQRQHGRHGLPWQGTRDPYRVWLSEIMLQQTQVATVRDYYPRFLARFPDVAALAAAPADDVMALWSGLGYYSRARHLHRCAQEVVARFGGQFPRQAETLQTLPGIGRSTAAAIAAFCFGERAAILDGNVKRVLTRHLGVADDLAVAAHEKALWQRADALLPTSPADMPAYTQALMDLGATVCTARQPRCGACPVAADCVARREGTPERYPVKTRKLKRGQQTLWLLHAHQTGQTAVWLHKRPARGIWAGLYVLPAFDTRSALLAALPAGVSVTDHAPFIHVLTHKDLHLHPVSARLPGHAAPATPGAWHADWAALGLPAPVRRFLASDASTAHAGDAAPLLPSPASNQEP
ncbi:MAG: A/G-specific adenine glycosylase [Comamonadaceae bacterium]|nr:A/G-specific adenine glycosylase [Comamonadaceae bacterium]